MQCKFLSFLLAFSCASLTGCSETGTKEVSLTPNVSEAKKSQTQSSQPSSLQVMLEKAVTKQSLSADEAIAWSKYREKLTEYSPNFYPPSQFSFNSSLGMYEVAFSFAVSYVTRDGRYILFNNEFVEIESGRNETQKAAAALRKLDLNQLDSKLSIKLSTSKTADSNDPEARVSVFLDPLCPYCKVLLKELNQLKNAEVDVYLVGFLGEQSAEKASSLYCTLKSGDSLESLSKHLATSDASQNACARNTGAERAAAASKHFRELGFDSVPVVIFPNGQFEFGSMQLDEIRKRLSQSSPTASTNVNAK